MPLLDRVARTGRRGRRLANRAETLRVAGVAYPLCRFYDKRRLGTLGLAARDAVYERIWRDAAIAVGSDIVPLGSGWFELSKGSARTRVRRQVVELDRQDRLDVALDKGLTHRLLVGAGVVTPEHVSFRFADRAPALEFLARVAGPCVVKPTAGSGGGHGVTAGVATPADLERACIYAARYTEDLLIERQAAGDVYRLLLLEGEILDVVRTVPARVTGDGVSSVVSLMRAENRRRVAAGGAAGLAELGIDLDLALTLARAGLSLSSVPAAGEQVTVRTVTNDSGAAECETFTGSFSGTVLDQVRAAVKVIGLRLAGVDVITGDPGRPLAEIGGVINDVNGTPGLHHHYLVAHPERATTVAVPILERLLAD